jgi:hypothetical protein
MSRLRKRHGRISKAFGIQRKRCPCNTLAYKHTALSHNFTWTKKTLCYTSQELLFVLHILVLHITRIIICITLKLQDDANANDLHYGPTTGGGLHARKICKLIETWIHENMNQKRKERKAQKGTYRRSQ